MWPRPAVAAAFSSPGPAVTAASPSAQCRESVARLPSGGHPLTASPKRLDSGRLNQLRETCQCCAQGKDARRPQASGSSFTLSPA